MAHLTLNCPTCRKQLVYVPLDGLTLHYRCAEHGLLIIRPLNQLRYDEQLPLTTNHAASQVQTHDAA